MTRRFSPMHMSKCWRRQLNDVCKSDAPLNALVIALYDWLDVACVHRQSRFGHFAHVYFFTSLVAALRSFLSFLTRKYFFLIRFVKNATTINVYIIAFMGKS